MKTAAAPARGASAAPASAPAVGAVPILVVDDHAENLLAMEAALAPLGEEIVMARSGDEALRRVLGRDFAAILLDAHMPGLDGFETAAMIRGRPRSAHVPIIIVTAIHQSEEDVARGYQIGAVDYLFKPIEPEAVRAKVAVFVEIERKRRALERLAATLEARVADRTADLDRANDRLRRLDAQRTEFLSIASHDLRTPIAAIQLALDNLLDGLFGAFTDRQRRPLEVARRNVDRLGRIIADLLDAARIETGRLVLDRRPADLREAVRRAADGVEPLLRADGAPRLEVALPDEPVETEIDADRIEQAVTNLLSNAIAYARGRIAVRLTADGETARIAVENDGPAIAEADIERIFDRFHRTSSSGAPPRGRGGTRAGLGLGLSIVKAVADGHGGTVRAENVAGGGGARFVVEIPVAARPRAETAGGGPAAGAAATGADRPGDPGDILVVEDDADLAEALRLRLEAAGYRVRVAGTVAEARAELASNAPALVVLDVALPDGSGFEILEAARADAGLAQVPFVVLTASGFPDHRDEALRRGARAYLAKPCAPADLVATIERLGASRLGAAPRRGPAAGVSA